ncbi:MAG: hypothetical protein A3E36_01425 [Candidatus Andersenbacteria bacterium RIFCSPHIGHO2_12_FULL_45_11b]|uniref:CBM-cenC domain-containing protein n=1 Tax=Candidatus Andersenbacteria bacterium RIFCSPHIGHO2_12_FULL_45_11b TaxID=1797282 RepID=A0A1G1X8S7_9BACT|nr:MAG: hypothetical protein A3E36_01425 [Candidatus Andersenbacteria bacterium RIFCSPHIGHO2_12_FULL_45_11b]
MLTSKTPILLLRFCAVIALVALPYYLFAPHQFIGGDDSRFFMVMPKPFLQNIAPYSWFHLSGFGRSNPNQFFLPLTAILSLAQTIVPLPTIVSYATFSAAFILGFLSFEKLLRALLPKGESAIPLVASLLYILSPIMIIGQWNNFLNASWLIGLVPALAYFYIQYMRSKKIRYVLWGCLAAIALSVGMASVPWFLGYLLPALFCAPIVIILHRKTIMNVSFWARSAFFALCIILSQSFWIMPLAVDIITPSPNGVWSGISQTIFQDSFAVTINATAIGNIAYPMLNLFHRELVSTFNWPQLSVFTHFYDFTMWVNVLIPIAFILALAKSKKSLAATELPRFLTLTTMYAVALFLFTVNIGILKPLFLSLGAIPGWVMFRNSFDKFAPGYVFYFSISIAFSLLIIKRAYPKYKIPILLAAAIIVAINALPIKQLINHPLWSTEHVQTVTKIPAEYTSFMQDVARTVPATSNILTLPLNNAGYSLVATPGTSRAYVGRSLVEPFANRYDYSGFLSFPYEYEQAIRAAVANEDYQSLYNIFKQFNIDYIITTQNIPEELQKSYLFELPLLEIQQDSSFINALSNEALLESAQGNFTLYRLKGSSENTLITIPEQIVSIPQKEDAASNTISALLPILRPGLAIIPDDQIKNFSHVSQLFMPQKASEITLSPGTYALPLISSSHSLNFEQDTNTLSQTATLDYTLDQQPYSYTASQALFPSITKDNIVQINDIFYTPGDIQNIAALNGDVVNLLQKENNSLIPDTSYLAKEWSQGDCNAHTNDPSVTFTQETEGLILEATDNHNACLYKTIALQEQSPYVFSFSYKSNNKSAKVFMQNGDTILPIPDSISDNQWHRIEIPFIANASATIYLYSGTAADNADTTYTNVELTPYKKVQSIVLHNLIAHTKTISVDTPTSFSFSPEKKTPMQLPPLSQWATGDCRAIDEKHAVFFSHEDDAPITLKAIDGHSACIYAKVDITHNTAYTFVINARSVQNQHIPFYVQFDTDKDNVKQALDTTAQTWQSATVDFQTPKEATQAIIYLYSGKDENADTEVAYQEPSLDSYPLPDMQPYLYKEPEDKTSTPSLASITSEKISPIAYRVHLSHMPKQALMQFKEPFHTGWNIYSQQTYHWYTPLLPHFRNAPHFPINSAASGWVLNAQDICAAAQCEGDDEEYSATILLVFTPQKWFYIGSMMTLLTLIGLSALLVKDKYYAR